MDAVRSAISNVGRDEEGRQFQYVGKSIGDTNVRIHTDAESFKAMEDKFSEVTDLAGKNFLEHCRRYWDDPDYREEEKRKIARRDRGRG